MLLESTVGEGKRKKEKKKGGKRKGQDGKNEQEAKRREQDWAKGEVQLRVSLSKGCGHSPGEPQSWDDLSKLSQIGGGGP